MFADYSYFRAEGASLAAIETVQEAKAEVASLKKGLAQRFGANDVAGHFDAETGRYVVHHFRFEPPKQTPAGWIEAEIHNTSATKYLLPAPNSPDHFAVSNIAGLMERAASKDGLEEVLKSGDMPLRDMQDGQSVSSRFVRYSAVEGAGVKPAGAIPDTIAGGFRMSGGPWRVVDELSYAQMGGDWYIRVPNRPGTERPVFTPPDAAPVSYDDILAIDGREQMSRFNKLRGSVFDKGMCC